MDVPVLFHTGENSGDSECVKWNDPEYIVEIAKKFPSSKLSSRITIGRSWIVVMR
jgi:hypothetical protein